MNLVLIKRKEEKVNEFSNKGNYKNTDLTFYETWNEDVDKKWAT